MQAIVIGAGVAGLTMALSLHQAGIAVRVFEAAREIKPLGVGLNIQPSAVRELHELGLAAQCAAHGHPIEQLRYYSRHAQIVWSEPRGEPAGYNWPQYSFHRGELQFMLLEAVRARIGAGNVLLGHRLVEFRQDADGVTARFAVDGGETELRGDVMIGADGIHSAVRRILYPQQGAPHFNKQILWRCSTAIPPFLGGRTMIVCGHFALRVIIYPILDLGTGRKLTNWIVQTAVDDDLPPPEVWNRVVPKARALHAIRDWRFDGIDVHAMIAQSENVLEFPLIDRDPVQRWSFGRVTLIGDAAHPMTPTGSQAGTQAIVDARCVAAELLAGPDPEAALLRYDARRRPEMNNVTLANRTFGPETALQLAEERAPNGFERLEDVISRQELESFPTEFRRITGLDAAAVNNRPSFLVSS